MELNIAAIDITSVIFLVYGKKEVYTIIKRDDMVYSDIRVTRGM